MADLHSGAYVLSRREQVALHAKAIGLTHREAARRLGATQKTLQRALASAVTAMGATTCTEAVALAVRAGLVDPTKGSLGEWGARPYTRRTYTQGDRDE